VFAILLYKVLSFLLGVFASCDCCGDLTRYLAGICTIMNLDLILKLERSYKASFCLPGEVLMECFDGMF